MQMAGFLVLLVVLIAAASVDVSVGLPYRQIGNISISNPAFIQVLQFPGAPPSLWITEFSAFASGKVYNIENVSSVYPDFSKAKPTLRASGLKWPNGPSVAPAEFGNYLVIPDGFLVPFKGTGAVYMLQANCTASESSDCDLISLTTSKSGWWYSQVQWKDMNGDGKLDLITARATKSIFGKTGGELLWLEQPPNDPLLNVPWKEHSLTEGPDVGFIVADLDADDDQFEVIATQFFSKRLKMYFVSMKTGSIVNSRDIDTDIGFAYWVDLVDLNNDSRLELLVTNHEAKEGGGVFAYEIPKDIQLGKFTKHTIATGFKVTESGQNQAAPGFAYAFKPHINYTGMPYLMVAGDGSQKAYLLQPTGKDFVYDMSVIIDVGGVIGSIGMGNLIGKEGWMEFFIPNYDGNELYTYTFAP